jgi:uncharacterized protein YecE (DUF72 family)
MTRKRSGRAWIGTSGWLYPHWRGPFYPGGLARHKELAYLAQRLSTVEVNGTFYSLTSPRACDSWRAAVPDDFLFAIKGSRYITHMLKLRNFEAPLANFLSSGVLRLGKKLGPILWQLPPQLPFDEGRATGFLSALPRTVGAAERLARRHDARTRGRAAVTGRDGRDLELRHALEARHPSWLEKRAVDVLRAAGVALVSADTAGRHPFSLERTASFAYLRLHGSRQLYASRYVDRELTAWARVISAWRSEGSDVYAYFDNDAQAHAPQDALRLAALLGIQLVVDSGINLEH